MFCNNSTATTTITINVSRKTFESSVLKIVTLDYQKKLKLYNSLNDYRIHSTDPQFYINTIFMDGSESIDIITMSRMIDADCHGVTRRKCHNSSLVKRIEYKIQNASWFRFKLFHDRVKRYAFILDYIKEQGYIQEEIVDEMYYYLVPDYEQDEESVFKDITRGYSLM